MRLILSVFFVFSAFLVGFAQNIKVTGSVTSSDDKQPIPGVNILIQGTVKGTGTDINGNYTIELGPGETTIEFSYIGYKKVSEVVGQRTVIDVTMEPDTKTLDEVVVVGYGVQKKSDITGATASVKGEELSKQPVLTATQAMQGKIAGVQIISNGQPGSSPQIRVRGVSTAFASTTSLYVVDGVLTDDISNINTSDIVDMNILKDASSAAIYGSRGANGVIIITTRKGVNGKLKVTYNNNIGIRQAANLVQMANAAEYTNYVQDATGKIPPVATANTDWYNAIMRHTRLLGTFEARAAVEQTHNVSVSGGTDKSTFLFNAGYMSDQGTLVDNNFKRLTLRLNSDYQLLDNLKLGIQSSYSGSTNGNGFSNIDIDPNGSVGGAYNDAYRAAPIIPSNINGKFGNTSVYQNVGNPLLDIKDNSVKAVNNRLQGSSYLQYTPIKGLILKTSIGADWQNQTNRQYNFQFSSGADGVFITPGGNQYNALSDLIIKNTQTFRWVWDNTANYSWELGKHNFTVLAGTTAEQYRQQVFSAYRNSVPADPSLWYIDTGNANSSTNSGGGDAWARNSYLGRLNYNFASKYLLTASFRRDGSSRLPSKNRWQNYPSLGVAWVLSNEDFFRNVQLFDQIKIRGSYGKVGNDQIPTNSYTSTVSQNQNYPYSGPGTVSSAGSLIQVIIDPNITWEVTTEYDLAVEFSLLNTKLSGEVNYYNKKLNNGLDQVPISVNAGANPAYIISNVMGIQNKGLEIVLNWKDRINDNMTYSISGNVTFNKNNVTTLRSGQNIYGGFVGTGSTTNTDVGHPVGSFYVLKTTGIFNSDQEVANDNTKYSGLTKGPGSFKYFDKNNDGVIDPVADKVFAGSYQPVAYYGVNLGLTYKGWDFSLGIYGNAGNKVYNGKKAARVSGTDNVEKSMVYNRWTTSNHSQTEPAANTGNLPPSTYFVESGSFIRINNVTIGYKIPVTNSKFTSCRVFLTSQNLYTYKKYTGFTAELPGGPTNSGIETNTYPTTRTIAVGVNIGF